MSKLANPITVKVDDATLAAIDEAQRAREKEAGVPLTRAVFVRLLIAAQLASVERGAKR